MIIEVLSNSSPMVGSVLDIIYLKFNPSAVIEPKTIHSANQTPINKKLFALNNVLQFVFSKFYPCVTTLSFDNIYGFSLSFIYTMATSYFLECFIS